MADRKRQESRAVGWAIASAVLLLLFLVLRPIIGGLGRPHVPSTVGTAPVVTPEAVGLPAGPSPSAHQRTPPSAPSKTSPGPAQNLEGIERRIVEFTNGARGSRKFLQYDPGLGQAARLHSNEMQAKGFFDHVNPQGEGPTERVALSHRRLIGLVGENIWMGEGVSVSDPDQLAHKIVNDWLRSPGHRANIESDRFTHIGVGVTAAGSAVYVTQNFAYIYAMTDSDVPLTVRLDTPVALSANGLAGQRATRFDVFDLARGMPAQGPADLTSATWHAPPGRYLIRFHFPSGVNRELIFNGPMVELK